jgi:hypothetical protein
MFYGSFFRIKYIGLTDVNHYCKGQLAKNPERLNSRSMAFAILPLQYLFLIFMPNFEIKSGLKPNST